MVDLDHDLFGEIKICQANRASVEGVGLDDVRAGFEILAVNANDCIRICQPENVGAVFKVLAPVCEALSSDLFLSQFKPIDHRTHRSVEDQDLLI